MKVSSNMLWVGGQRYVSVAIRSTSLMTEAKLLGSLGSSGGVCPHAARGCGALGWWVISGLLAVLLLPPELCLFK